MSLFDYPRINVKGTVQVNPGTANNDDYAGAYYLPENWGPLAGETLGLIDSKMVQARTYGMSDEDFVRWVQKAQTFVTKSGTTVEQIPAEWNYYGDMGLSYRAKVIGVQTDLGKIYAEPTRDTPITDVIGMDLECSGRMTDINPEGSPPATQFFLGTVSLTKGGETVTLGTPSKGVGQWINFFRNVNLTEDAGAGTYLYHVIKAKKIDIPGFEKANGVIFRYYLYRPLLDRPLPDDRKKANANIEKLYEKRQKNPKTLEFVGTIAPWHESERILTTPTGRLLISDSANIPTPPGFRNNGCPKKGKCLIALGPAVLQQKETTVFGDFVGTFPDNYQDDQNAKFDFGPVALFVSSKNTKAKIGAVDYADTDAGDRRGWLFEFDITNNQDAQEILKKQDAAFQLVQEYFGNALEETEYFFVSNQLALYAEQHGSRECFVNQGSEEPATVSVFHRGQELTADSCPPITLWQYRSTPLQAPGDAEVISANFKPGEPIQLDTSQPGNVLLTFTISDDASPPPAGYPPKSYSEFYPPHLAVTNLPSISVRILPNEEDFSKYYVDPSADEPVGNDLLTFDIVYEKVLRTYYLLYPIMNTVFELNSENAVKHHAQDVLNATDPAGWMSPGYMPPTRDLSASRRTLLRAWCRKVLHC